MSVCFVAHCGEIMDPNPPPLFTAHITSMFPLPVTPSSFPLSQGHVPLGS